MLDSQYSKSNSDIPSTEDAALHRSRILTLFVLFYYEINETAFSLIYRRSNTYIDEERLHPNSDGTNWESLRGNVLMRMEVDYAQSLVRQIAELHAQTLRKENNDD